MKTFTVPVFLGVNAETKQEAIEEALVRDLLADLRHYCDAHNIDFAYEDRVGYRNYTEELEELK